MASYVMGKTFIVPTIISAMAIVTVATAQTSGSPFANKKKKQAWELAPPSPPPQPQPRTPQNSYPAPQTLPGRPSQPYAAPQYQQATAQHTPSQPAQGQNAQPGSMAGAYQSPQVAPAPKLSSTPYQAPASGYDAPTGQPSGGSYYQQTAPAAQSYSFPQNTTGTTPQFTGPQYTPPSQPAPAQGGAYYPGRPNAGHPYANQPYSQGYGNQGYGNPDYADQQYPAQTPYGQTYGQPPQYGNTPTPRPPQSSWTDRLGFNNLKTTLSGFFKLGAAATENDGWGADVIAEGNVKAGVSAFTEGGLEYGVNLEARAQYDKYRRGFGGLVGDCPPGVPGCASVLVGTTDTAIRGHTSQFYASGPDNAKEAEIALEGAYLFLRSAYGDVTLGRDDGAAYLFSLGAPTLLAINASNSPLDYTGLDSVKTVNDASGFAEKITYTSPRLLGDQIGLGVQMGLSYAPNARACGVDYCVRSNGKDGTGVLSPDLKDVVEFGIALDRKFDSGLSVEATATYATASESSGLAVFDGLSAYNAGLEFGYNDWTLGGSWLQSNNGLADGDYSAWDLGMTWKPSDLGITLGYGHARDKNIDLTSDQAVFGVTYDFDKFRLGTGVQYIERRAPVWDGMALNRDKEKGVGLFIEGGFEF